MLILGLDTTTRAGSCALARDGVVLREEGHPPADQPAVRLPADLMRLLTHAGVALDAIDVFAVATGPGSFTGLRIGIATMQGLAFATGKPLLGVSGLDALAARCGEARFVATWVDAWRGEVYGAFYDHGREVRRPIVATPAELLQTIGSEIGPQQVVTFIGDGAASFREEIVHVLGSRAHVADPAAPPLAGTVTLLAAARAERGERPPPHAIRPLYVRRPDAELARDRL